MYPWLVSHRQQLRALVRRGQLGHALLLKGMAGMGKHELARDLAQTLLCQHATAAPCGNCHSCQLNAAASHPDHHVISGRERSIGIDAIRQLSQVLNESARLGHGKVAVIMQAEKMTEAAANALLKTLEEPAGEATLILTSAHPEQLLPTVRSRCQQWPLPIPDSDSVLAWLSAEGQDASLTALNVNQGSPLNTRDYLAAGADRQRRQLLQQFAELAYHRHSLPTLQQGLLAQPRYLQWLQLLLQDALQLALGVNTSLRLVDSEPLCRQLSRLGTARLNQALTELIQLRRMLQPTTGRPVNVALQLGQWLNRWTQLSSAASSGGRLPH
ncbi:DNA polymerase III subunit delta' [Zobellella sp. DQSA1]|uniref:DNA polymerase III subunit delta' n=1 Tax=Zobellella sp. DQSA1 TaxID=3342386 RepID=UPI0035C1BE06